MLSVHPDGPLPERFIAYPDDAALALEDFLFVEGPPPVSRFKLALVGGVPLPDTTPPVPVPPTLPLLAGGVVLPGLGRRIAQGTRRDSRSAA